MPSLNGSDQELGGAGKPLPRLGPASKTELGVFLYGTKDSER
jgi:hypothetical protein